MQPRAFTKGIGNLCRKLFSNIAENYQFWGSFSSPPFGPFLDFGTQMVARVPLGRLRVHFCSILGSNLVIWGGGVILTYFWRRSGSHFTFLKVSDFPKTLPKFGQGHLSPTPSGVSNNVWRTLSQLCRAHPPASLPSWALN